MTQLDRYAPSRPGDLSRVSPGPSVSFNRERRSHARRAALVDRIRAEFREMQGLSITVAQAARLFGIPAPACQRILIGLVAEGLLHVRTDARYVLRDWSR